MVSPSDSHQHPPPTDTSDGRPSDYVSPCQSQSNPEFLGAATELLSCVATLSPTEFRRQSRKIIRLIETARDTLEASGISLYLFTAASCHKGKWKDAYFDLSPCTNIVTDKLRKPLALGITTCTPQPDSANTAAPCITMPRKPPYGLPVQSAD
ncbi:hypothetical protein B0H14DRAFT_3075472 [Mycena olivaceomarginata]|nr:hypothetical protein B0H14DRAFT_3075472 [Mycena olivaceomarginata]